MIETLPYQIIFPDTPTSPTWSCASKDASTRTARDLRHSSLPFPSRSSPNPFPQRHKDAAPRGRAVREDRVPHSTVLELSSNAALLRGPEGKPDRGGGMGCARGGRGGRGRGGRGEEESGKCAVWREERWRGQGRGCMRGQVREGSVSARSEGLMSEQ
eukprot:1524160-Rhodomonas_salina.1